MSRRLSDTIFAGILLALCCALYVETLSDAYRNTGLATMNNAVFYPRILLAVLSLLSLAVLARAWRAPPDSGTGLVGREVMTVGGTVIVTIVYAAIFMHVPFVIAGAVYCALLALILGYRRIPALAIVSCAIPAAIWLVFEAMLGIRLP